MADRGWQRLGPLNILLGMKCLSRVGLSFGFVAAISCAEQTAPAIGPPASLEIVSGSEQVATAGKELPNALRVRVSDSADHPVANQIITFHVLSGGGTVFSGTALTNAEGIAQERWTLGTSTAAAQTLEARAVDATTGERLVFGIFTATAQADVPAVITAQSTADQYGVAGAAAEVVPSVRVADQYDNPVSGIGVSFSVSAGGAVSGGTTTTNALGVATLGNWTLATSGGVNTVTATASTLPSVVFTARTFVISALTAGSDFSCALANGGAAYCWGEPSHLGNGGMTLVLKPVEVSGQRVWSAIAAGFDHACGVASGTAYCWGHNQFGSVGDGTSLNLRQLPVQVQGALTFNSITAGYHFSCGETMTGTRCWGWYGAVSPGPETPIEYHTPTSMGGPGFTSVVGRCGLTAAGAAWCWGKIPGNGAASSEVPVEVSGGLTFTSLAATSVNHVCGVSGGKAYCWGRNDFGEIGDTTSVDAAHPGTLKPQLLVPTQVVGNQTFSSVVTGNGYTCALTTTGAPYCWGANYLGQLGIGSVSGASAKSPTPSLVGGGRTFISLAAGAAHTLGLTAAGEAWCWGQNEIGQCGDGNRGTASTPVKTVMRP